MSQSPTTSGSLLRVDITKVGLYSMIRFTVECIGRRGVLSTRYWRTVLSHLCSSEENYLVPVLSFAMLQDLPVRRATGDSTDH